MKKIFVLVASLFLCTLFANAQNNVIDNELQKILNQKGNDYIDVNIMLKAQMTSDDFAVLNCKSDSKEVRREIVTNELKKFAEKSQKDIMSVLQAEERSKKITDIQNFWIANFINCKAKADVIYQLASHPDVATISYNSVMEVVSDSKETESRDTRAVTATIGEHLKRIKADQVWDLGYTGKGVIVAVLDSGVNTEHADLKDHLWNENGKYGYNVVDPSQNPYDDRSHGTHCAGIICGDGTSGMMTGVAPDATLMSIKVYADGSGLTVPRLLEGVQFAANNGAKILNISQGWLGATDANRNTLRTAFKNLLAQNIVTVVAAGNDRESIATYPVPGNIRTPGDCPPPWLHPDQPQTTESGVSSVVSVGAVTYNEFNVPSIAAISSQGPVEWYDYPYNPAEMEMGLIRPDIVAPGTIRSLSNESNDGYVSKGGTSQAAPCVAGVMALMLDKNPDLTPEDLCRIVERTTTQTPAKKDNLYGSGVVDALEAVRAVTFNVDEPVLNVYDFTRTFNAGSNLDFELTLINNGKASTDGNTTVTISENDTYTTINNGSATYGTMGVMNLQTAHSSVFIKDVTEPATFVVSFDQSIPDNYEVTFTVKIGSRTFDIVVTVYNELVAPTLNATANGTDINLSWNATNNATSYNIYRDGVLLKNTPLTSYTDAGLDYGTIYAYTVTTKRNELESEHSLTVRVQTADNPAKPSPTNVVATNNGTNVSVTWTNGAESKGSNIYRKDYLTGTETSIATNVNGTSYTDNTWNSLEGIYQYGVANLYAANENIYEENLDNLTNLTEIDWYAYKANGASASWSIKEAASVTSNGNTTTFSAFSGKAAFTQPLYVNDNHLSYLVSKQMNYTQHAGKKVCLSFKYITPTWTDNGTNTLKVMVSTTSYNSGWSEALWSSNKTDVQEWTEAEVDLSAYVGQPFYIAFVNYAGSGYCTGVDDVCLFIEGSSESRIEWSDIVSKNVNMFVKDGDWSNTDNWTANRLPNENDTKVIIDADATITTRGNITVNSLVINEGKSLTLNDGVILTVNGDFANTDVDAFIINDGAQVFQNNDDVAATFNMNIVNPGEWSESNKTGWQFIASPLKYSKISDFVPSSSDYDLYKYDGTKELEWLNHKDETTYEVPTAPQNLLAEAISTSTIALSWDAVVGASSYKVYFNETFISTASNTFEVTGLEPGTKYCYSVAAVNAHGESDKSEEACTKTITLAPQDLVATMESHSSIVLEWNSVDGAERYVVYKDSEPIASFVTKTSYTVTGLTQATEYCFTVTAVNYPDGVNGKESAHSNKDCATTDITIPSAPQNVVLVATSPYSVKLTWDPVPGADSYNIYFIAGGEAASGVVATEYIFEGLTPGMGYCYNVTAVNAKGESQPNGSNSVNTPLPTPEAPQLTATATGPATVKLTWNAPTYAETYKVYEGNRLVVEGISSTTHTVYDLVAGQHCFTVIAVNSVGGESGASIEDCATVTEQEQGPIVENVIIGEDESVIGVLPLASNLAFSISQQIYTRAEIGQTGSIKAVSFKYKSGVTSSCTRAVKVYLKQTTKEVFANTTDWLSMTDDADLVYDGNITINGIADEWVRIKLTTPFEYTGNNLAVCVYDYTNRADATITFAADKVSDKKALYYTPLPWNASELNPSNVNKTGYFTDPLTRNQIRFSFVTGNEPGIPAAPTNLIATCSQEMPDIDVYANAITLKWDTDATAEIYHIYDEEDNKIGQTGGTTFTIEGLECATRYCYYVSAENETGEGAKAEVCTTTITARPQNVVARSTDETTINLSWDHVETATSYKVYLGGLHVGTTTTTSFDITGLTTGEPYCHSVAAVNEGGESEKSVCAFAIAGDIQLETIPITFILRDSWGDGWNGNKLSVSYPELEGTFNGTYTIDETTFDPYPYNASKRYTYTFTLEIPKGCNVTLTYIKSNGANPATNENSFDVKCENGLVLASAARDSLKGGEVFEFIADCTPKVPNAPVLEANATSSTEIALTWNEVATATSYNVYQDDAEIATGLTTTTYNVEGLNPGTNYCFTVTAVNATGESEATEACATTEAAPVEPETQDPNVVTIGDASANNTTTNANYPFANTNKYSHSQQIYTPTTISAFCEQIPEGDITKIKYYIAETSQSYFSGVKVYMRNSLTSSFSSRTAWDKDFTADDLVFEGEVDVVDNAIEFVLEKTFTYDPTMNLIIYVDVDTKNGTSQTKFKTYSAAANCALYYKSQNTNGGLDTDYLWKNSSAAAANTINVVSLTFAGEGGGEEPETPVAPTAPASMTATANGQNSITLTWEAGENATSYNIYTPNNYAGSNVLGLEATTYTFEGLTAGTEYCFEVSSVNTVGESDATKACATTEAATVEPEQPGNDLIVTVGSGSEVEAFVPVNTNYDNTISQQIYLAEDFQGKTGKIKSYAFKCAKDLSSYGTPITVTRNFKVYMINTDKSSFTSASDWAAVTESDLVFDGSVTFQPKDEWTVVTFDTPFEYEEGKNVLICINDASKYVNGTMNYYSHVTENVRSLVFYADGNPYDATAIAVSSKFDNLKYVAQAQFTFAKSSSASATMTDLKAGFEKANSVSSSGTELSKFEPTFQQGIGYLASYETETTATFKGTLNHEKSYTFNLAAYDDSKNLANFSLLGNPFSFNMNWANTTVSGLVNGYAVVNEQGGYEYLTSGEIKVGDGFFVKATDANPSLTYNTRGNRNHEKVSSLNVISSSKAGDDNVIINLAGEQEGFPKIKNFNENIAVVYVTEDDMAYGIYNCNEDALEVELAFKVSNMGEYNIHIEPNGYFDYVTLVDLSNGSETNMLTSSYSFTAVPKENGKRFVLKFAKSEMPEGQDNFVYQSGKELIVETEGTVQIIDIMGRVIYSNEVTNDNNRIDISGLHSAAYIVRLINNDSVKTQKVVVY